MKINVQLHKNYPQKKYMMCSLNGQIQLILFITTDMCLRNRLAGFRLKAPSISSPQVLLTSDRIFYSNMDSNSAQ